ncbi:nucleotidyltransferase domain-containing protein [Thermosulfurimonas sp. F29]|uniref:nucleotidyltransferase domain-containing protein n=1 Tax=Thermosulfurimonas sp. F29 TaxID=2867247 RepID=UPI002102BF7A|nr:nucleotidyltransferase domain-containing protein [Thermosulfurimonas sp. F29]
MELLRRERRVEKVVLFGSLAEGRATTRSDADLLIITDGDFRDRWTEWILHFTRAPLPVDVIPVKKERLDLPLARRALTRGIVLAERDEVEAL